MDVAEWLAGLGLDRYAAEFAAQAIDAELLATLTEDDLTQLGVVTVGHRRRLLNAIAVLREVPPASGRPPASRTAERRQLTVMFVDLVGSTALSRQLDPEDMRELIRRYQIVVAGEITRLDGHVAKYMGDGVLAYFGWPRAHEGEAERAVRAGLAITAAVADLRTPAGDPLAARAGIATGLVVVGDLIGEGAAQEAAVVGETPNLAARLQALAPPGGLLVADSTHRLLGGLFEVAPVGGLAARGFDEGVLAWRVLGASTTTVRFEARGADGIAPMVGRAHELGLLGDRWLQACRGQGQAVLVAGEAGIGKSRLLRGLRDAGTGDAHTEIHWQCSPFHAESPLWPVIQHLAVAGDAVGLAGLERRLRDAGLEPGHVLPSLAVRAEATSPPPASELSAELSRQRTLQILGDHIVALAAEQPLLIQLEDVHWADATTLELVGLLLGRIGTAPVLLAITGRTEGLPTLPAVPHLTRLTLSRLDRTAIAALLGHLLRGRDSPASLVDAVAARTDGVPLFVEELAKMLAERSDGSGLGDAGDAVPASLHDALMARLDRLPAAKEVAQIAACIGREFDHRLLAAIADRNEAELESRLEELCATELLYRRGVPPEASYSFKHALVRDAAYDSLLKSRRRTIHAELLAALERGVVPARAEELGHHAAAAEIWAKALHHYGAAGKAALDRAANAEGLALSVKALDAGGRLTGDITAEVAMIDLHRARSWAHLTVGDTLRMLAELREAETRAARFGMARLTCQLKAQRTHVESIFGGHTRRAVRYGREAARIARAIGDADLTSAARFVTGYALLFAGDARAAVAELAVDADAYQRGLRIIAAGSSGTLAVDGLATLGHALGQLGRWDEALARGAEARAVAAETGSPWDMNVANYHLARDTPHQGRRGGSTAADRIEPRTVGAHRPAHGAALVPQAARPGAPPGRASRRGHRAARPGRGRLRRAAPGVDPHLRPAGQGRGLPRCRSGGGTASGHERR